MDMKRGGKLWVIWLLIAAMFLLAGCGSSQEVAVSEEGADGDHRAEEGGEHSNDEEHDGSSMEHEHIETPDEFTELSNPFAGDEAAIAAGREIFAANCVACHGETGQGDGAAAASLDPKPADLTDPTMINSLSDGYLFWRVSQGGAVAPFNSAMPAWENALTEEQRWQVVSYIRSLTDERVAAEEERPGHEEEHDEGQSAN